MGENESRTKYNVDRNIAKRTYNEIVFDSEAEMKYFRDVVCPQVESGSIVHYELQKPYELQPSFEHGGIKVKAIVYVADFYIEYSDGRSEVIDVKGCPDSISKLKRKMFWYHYPTTVYRWVCYSLIDGGWCDYEVVDKARKLRKKERKKLQEEKEKQNG